MENQKVKSFFERPEGNTGIGLLAVLITGLLVGGYYLLPILIVILQNTLYAGLLGAAVLSLVALAMNENVQFVVSSGFKSFTRALASTYIEMNPIAILKGYLEEMLKRIAKIEENIEALSGQISNTELEVSNRTKSINKSMSMADAAQKRGDDSLQLYLNKAAREKEFVIKLTETLNKMKTLKALLSKMKKNVEFLYEDTSNEVEIREAEYKAVKASYKAMKNAKSVIQGDKQRDMFEQALEFTATDIGMKLGEIDRFMEASQDFTSNMDLQNVVFNEKGLDMLTQWKENGSILDYTKGQKVRVDTSLSTAEIAEQQNYEASLNITNKPNQFTNLFK